MLREFETFSPLAARPLVDLKETERDYTLEAELPGVPKDQIKLECPDENSLILEGFFQRQESTAPTKAIDQGDGVIPSGAEVSERNESSQIMRQRSGRSLEHSSRYWHTERAQGYFQRAFTFPSPIQSDGIQASFKGGLLSVIIPKAEKKYIPVKITVD